MKKIEVEGGELAIKNRNGDVAIVPKEKRGYVKSLIDNGHHDKVDSFISMLPKMATRAAKGTVVSNPKKKKTNPDAWSKDPKQPEVTWEDVLREKNPEATKWELMRAKQLSQGGGSFMSNFVDPSEREVNISARISNDPSIVERAFGPKYPPVSIADNRTIRATTGQPINPNVDLVSGKYNLNNLDQTMYYAKQHGLNKEDLWNLSAMAMQETKMGNAGDGTDNIGHVISSQYDSGVPGKDFVDAYVDKMKTAKRLGINSEEKALQAYNGLGIITPQTEADYHGFEMQKIYGVPIPKEGLNLKENPLYGIQVKDLRDNVLKQNPELVNYIDSTYSTFKPPIKLPNKKIKS